MELLLSYALSNTVRTHSGRLPDTSTCDMWRPGHTRAGSPHVYLLGASMEPARTSGALG